MLVLFVEAACGELMKEYLSEAGLCGKIIFLPSAKRTTDKLRSGNI